MDEIEAAMTTLLHRRVSGLPLAALAEVFDRLVWCLDDNGADLLKVREKWLRGDDRAKAETALAMCETLPFADEQEATRELGKVAVRWPDLSGRCEEILLEWAQVPSRTHGQGFGS